jgi:hypothetical protein
MRITASDRFRQVVARVALEREVSAEQLLGRSPSRIPKAFQRRLTVRQIIEIFGGDPWMHVDSGGLVGQKAFAAAVAELPEEFRLCRRQMYNALYPQPWIHWVGERGVRVPGANVASVHHFLKVIHPLETLTAHLAALRRGARSAAV